MTFDRIAQHQEQPVEMAHIRGKNVRVCEIVEMMADGMTSGAIRERHPQLEEADISEAILYAAEYSLACCGDPATCLVHDHVSTEA
jgi:uncharacterized protein (DUF433 family)